VATTSTKEVAGRPAKTATIIPAPQEKQWKQQDHAVVEDLIVLTEGPSTKHPEANNRMEMIDLTR
jgi:hypothetical protein